MLAALVVLLVCLQVLAGCSETGAGVTDRERSRALLAAAEAVRTQDGIPGLAIAVTRGGKVFQTITLGYSDLSTHAKVSGSTPFQLASTTKLFASTGVLLLVADGSVRLDDPVGQYLEAIPAGWKQVTIRQLLSHTSGLPDITRKTGEIDLVAMDWDRALARVAKQPLRFAPGTDWAYTQTNYALLQRLIERVSGMRFEAFLEARLFRPLGMHATFFPGPGRRCAINYTQTPQGRPVERTELSFPRYVHAAGGLCSSLDDQLAWSRAIEAGKVIPLGLLNQARTPARLADGRPVRVSESLSYGLGRAMGTRPGARWAGHSGGNSSAVRRYLDTPMTIIVLHNGTSNPNVIADSLARTMLETTAADNAQADLWDAARMGNRPATLAALQAGADVNALDTRSSRNGRRALNWAALRNHPAVIELLLAHGADIDARNLSGFTALHHAAESGSLAAARVLLASGADLSMRNAQGETAAEVARRMGHADVAALIEGAGGTSGKPRTGH